MLAMSTEEQKPETQRDEATEARVGWCGQRTGLTSRDHALLSVSRPTVNLCVSSLTSKHYSQTISFFDNYTFSYVWG